MCGFTKKNGHEGILFRDGIFVRIEDVTLDNLTAEQRRELEEMRLVNELAIRKRLHEIGNILQKVNNRIDDISQRLDEARKGGIIEKEICPVNTPAIEEIAERTTKRYFRETILTAGNIAKAITAIITLLTIFGILFEAIKK